MGDVVVTRADREAAAKLLEGSSPYLEEADSRLWVESGEDFFGDVPEGDAELYYATAATIARVRIAAERAGYERGVREGRRQERERCGLVLERFADAYEREQTPSKKSLCARMYRKCALLCRGLADKPDDYYAAMGEHAKEGV